MKVLPATLGASDEHYRRLGTSRDRIELWEDGIAYLRFTGDLKFEHYQTDTLVETQRDESLWELMYFGHVPRE